MKMHRRDVHLRGDDWTVLGSAMLALLFSAVVPQWGRACACGRGDVDETILISSVLVAVSGCWCRGGGGAGAIDRRAAATAGRPGSSRPGTPRPAARRQMALRCARERAPSLMEGPLFAAAPQAAAASFFGANSTSTAQAGATNAVTAPRNPNTAPRHLFSSTNSSSTGPEVLGNCWTSEDTWHNVYSWINNSQVRKVSHFTCICAIAQFCNLLANPLQPNYLLSNCLSDLFIRIQQLLHSNWFVLIRYFRLIPQSCLRNITGANTHCRVEIGGLHVFKVSFHFSRVILLRYLLSILNVLELFTMMYSITQCGCHLDWNIRNYTVSLPGKMTISPIKVSFVDFSTIPFYLFLKIHDNTFP